MELMQWTDNEHERKALSKRLKWGKFRTYRMVEDGYLVPMERRRA